MRNYNIRYVDKICPKDTDRDVKPLPDSSFSDRKTLGAALRKAGVLSKGARIQNMRVEGDRTIIFPICPGLSTYWHAITISPKEEET